MLGKAALTVGWHGTRRYIGSGIPKERVHGEGWSSETWREWGTANEYLTMRTLGSRLTMIYTLGYDRNGTGERLNITKDERTGVSTSDELKENSRGLCIISLAVI